MLLTVANQKGGVGKTTFLVNYAYYLNEKQNKSVCVIDLDTQANCTLVLSNENKIDTSYNLFKESINIKKYSKDKINLYYSETNLLDEEEYNKEIYLKNIQQLNEIFDCVLIDTAPVVSNRLIYSLQKSDYVITPIELEVFSLQGLELMLNTIFNIKKEYNHNMTFLGVLPSRVNTTNPRQLKALENLKIEYGQELFLPYIKNRNDIANALANQQSIFKSKSKHKKEILDVFDYIYNKTI